MNINHLHDWTLNTTQAKQVQIELADKVIKSSLSQNIYAIAGVDVSVSNLSRDKGRAAIVVINYPELKIIDLVIRDGKLDFPYVPGLLSFREMPIVLSAFQLLSVKPDLIIVDGQGIAHPRRLGLACHMGLFLDVPTIGCAKSLLCGSYSPVKKNRGAVSQIVDKEETIGVALRTKTNVKPVFVSIGHKIDLQGSIEWTLRCCQKYRLPEPSRLAHMASIGKIN